MRRPLRFLFVPLCCPLLPATCHRSTSTGAPTPPVSTTLPGPGCVPPA